MASESKTAIVAAIAGNLAIAVTKLIAAAVSGSSAMTAEAIHSLADTGNGGLLLLGLRRSRKPPDLAHPLGYGRELYFWSFIVAILIFGLGGGMSIFEGITHLNHPTPIEDPSMSYVVLGIAAVFEGVSWVFGWRAFRTVKGRRGVLEAVRESKDPTSFMVVFEDTAALLGLAVAFLGVFLSHRLNNPSFDGAASIVIGIILSLIGLFLAYESKELLIGEGVDARTIQRIRELVSADPAIEHVDHALTYYLAPHDVILILELKLRDRLPGAEVRATLERLAANIRKEYPDIKRVYFEPTSLAEMRHRELMAGQEIET